ncbi:MAG: hypothetical protein WDN44_06120 [Sphingomonas sp.]
MSEAADGKARGARFAHALFVVAILSGSFLLFLVQPMVARMALPKLGGAPAVWNSAMLVYQALLLGGYAYAHWLGRVPPAIQAWIHLGVLAVAALWLPIGLSAMELPADAQPAIWVPWLFGASIGPLFFAIAAQAPLLQRWYSVATGGRDPYALYAASNIGSFGGLLAYPLLVEPLMTLKSQSLLWTAGYILVAGADRRLRGDAAPPHAGCGACPAHQPAAEMPPGAALGGAVVRAVGADARDHDLPDHRHRRGANAVGAPARALFAELHRRLFGQSWCGRAARQVRAGHAAAVRRDADRRAPGLCLSQRLHRAGAAVHGRGLAPRADVCAAAGARSADRILPRDVGGRSARRDLLRAARADPVRLDL